MYYLTFKTILIMFTQHTTHNTQLAIKAIWVFLFFLFFTPFVAIAQDDTSVNHDCPGATTGNCKEFDDIVKIDIGEIWGEPGTCYMYYPYKYKICFGNNTYTFEVIKSPMEEYLFDDLDCQNIFNLISNDNLINSLIVDHVLASAALENTAFTIANTFTQSLLDKSQCDKGGFFISGTYFYGPCAASCRGARLTGNPKKPIAIVTYRNIVCGANCCFETAQFCVKAGSKVGDVKLESKYLGIQSTTKGNLCTQKAGDHCPEIPGIKWFNNGISGTCYSACDLDLPKVKSNSFVPIKIKKENLEINEEQIKVNISQQDKIFIFDFKTTYSGKVFLLDTNGRNVYSNSLSNLQGEFSIDASNLPTGIYFVYLQNENSSVNKKIFLH